MLSTPSPVALHCALLSTGPICHERRAATKPAEYASLLYDYFCVVKLDTIFCNLGAPHSTHQDTVNTVWSVLLEFVFTTSFMVVPSVMILMCKADPHLGNINGLQRNTSYLTLRGR